MCLLLIPFFHPIIRRPFPPHHFTFLTDSVFLATFTATFVSTPLHLLFCCYSWFASLTHCLGYTTIGVLEPLYYYTLFSWLLYYYFLLTPTPFLLCSLPYRATCLGSEIRAWKLRAIIQVCAGSITGLGWACPNTVCLTLLSRKLLIVGKIISNERNSHLPHLQVKYTIVKIYYFLWRFESN